MTKAAHIAPPATSTSLLPAVELSTRRTDHLKAELLAALGAAALATAIGIWVLRLWQGTLQVPIYSAPGDALFNLVMIKDVITHGWDVTNSSLAMPFGQQLYDFPALDSDSFYMAIIKGLGAFSSNPAVVLNIFYLMGFPLIALTTFWTLRKLSISISVAIVCATLYAVLPFRFESGEMHVFLSSYFTVPISCYLILLAFQGTELFARNRERSGLRSYLTYRSALILATCLLLGSSDSYFALFTVALLIPAATLAFLANRRLRTLIGTLFIASLIVGTIALNGLPTILYDAQHGVNTVPSTRYPQEADIWSLSLANMVLPIENNRIPVLATLAYHYDSTTEIPNSAPGSEPVFTNLGLAGTFGLLWLSITLGLYCTRNKRLAPSQLHGVYAALGAGLAFLIGTVGGLATIFAYVVTPQFHAPARICLFIAFFAMFGAALALDRLRGVVGTGRTRHMAFIAVLAAILIVGVLYQTSPSMAPAYAVSRARYEARSKFIRAIEATVPSNASIFQIPYMPFPLGVDPNHIKPYEDLYPYIFSKGLRWSGGAMEGRPTNWVPRFLNRPLPQIVEGVSALGFQGIYIDVYGLGNNSTATALIPQLQHLLGVTPIISADGRFLFFNMIAYDKRFRIQHTSGQIANIAAAALS